MGSEMFSPRPRLMMSSMSSRSMVVVKKRRKKRRRKKLLKVVKVKAVRMVEQPKVGRRRRLPSKFAPLHFNTTPEYYLLTIEISYIVATLCNFRKNKHTVYYIKKLFENLFMLRRRTLL